MGAAVNTTLIAGVFPAQRRQPVWTDLRCCGHVGLCPLGFIAAFVLNLPVLWIFLICTDEFVKWPLGHPPLPQQKCLKKRYQGRICSQSSPNRQSPRK